ncbi:MAG TPA: YfcE family phosphodiesterase [Candidatus Limosilactobacillus faecipullorum]|nr:YfcE family phosphodiesterase [Candidatus Limosilactobacillus faecipullorum]
MKVLLVSDNHGDAQILQTIHDHFEGKVDAFFHCGDSNLPSNDPVMAPYQTVIGNTDWGFTYPSIVQKEFPAGKVVITHGHKYQVNTSLTPLLMLAREKQALIMGFGHTHQLGCEVVKGTLFINPGSISQPRGEYTRLGGTFATVEVTSNTFEVQYYTRDCHPVNELKFSLKLTH